MKHPAKAAVKAVVCILIACLSVFCLAGYMTSPEISENTISTLDSKKSTVLDLTAASAAASAAITLLPGDAATPIADKLADISGYFLIVLAAIYLEKYLVPLTGYAAFYILIPAGFLIFALNAFLRDRTLKHVARKLVIFGIAVTFLIPASVKVSEIIDRTYEGSIQETVSTALAAADDADSAGEAESSGLSGLFSTIKNGVTGASDFARTVLNHFIEAFSVMLVTSCVIPIVVLLFFVWLVKIILGANIDIPSFRKRPGRREEGEVKP